MNAILLNFEQNGYFSDIISHDIALYTGSIKKIAKYFSHHCNIEDS